MFNLDTVTSKNDIKSCLIQQDNNNLIDKIYLYVKDLDEPKYKFLVEKRKQAGLKNLNDSTDCFY